MFKSKLEIDRHVDNCLKKVNNETERNLKGFSFAKLYFKLGDYEQAQRYVSSYLSVKPFSADGYQLLGKCLEKMNRKDAALEAYRSSLQIDSKQNNLVLKVCELLASDEVNMDYSGAKYFCDMAQTYDPDNNAVHRLKEKLISKQSDNPQEVSKLLLKELENRPTDVNLRVRLLKHFLHHNMLKDAYTYASATEEKNFSIFHSNLSWYETLAEVLLAFQRDITLNSQINWEFWVLSVSVSDKLVTLSLDENIDNKKTSSDYIATVFNFDQMLTKASQNMNTCPDRQLISFFLCHYYGQLNFHLATLAYKQAKYDLMSFKEVSNITIPLLLIAYHSYPPDLQNLWYIHTSESNKRLVQQWHKEASYRCSQTGHMLLGAAKNRKSLFIEKATQYSTGMWREQLFKKIFVKRNHHLNISTSYFVSNPQVVETVYKLPDPEDVLKHDEVAQLMYPDSLHHYIWMALHNKLQDMDVKAFEGLHYSVKNLNNCAAESMSLLDIQAFLYCAIFCAKAQIDDKIKSIYYNREKPKMLPASITNTLGTLNQSKFLKAAYKVYKNEPGSSMGEIRLLLIKGIEVVRCVGHHSLGIELLVKLAEIFEERAKKRNKQSEIEHNTARAELYWKTALPLLERIKNKQLVTYPTNRLFEYKSREISSSETLLYIEKGELFTALQLMKKKEYEKALRIFENLKNPYASFYQSQIYKNMADQKTSDSKENVTSEMRSQHIILLSKARDCLYLTLDRLREPTVDRTHPLNAQLGSEIEKMERLLSRIDPDCTNRNECDGMSDENPSSENSIGDQYLSTCTHTSFHNGPQFTPKHEIHNHSTPLRFSITRQEARPSPERLDAQIRQLATSRDAAFSNIIEQNKLIVESHRNLLEELRSFKEAVNNLSSMVDELKTIKTSIEHIKNIEKSMEEIKHSFDLSNLMDSIQQIQKELNELKKEHNKSNQLGDEDLHFLDSDYAVDYNINSNIGYSPSISNMYPTYQPGRIQNPNPLTAYHGLYPSLYPGFYGALTIPQTGAVPLQVDQQNLGAAATVNYQQPALSHALIPPVLPTCSVNVSKLTGQTLSQTISPSQKALLTKATNVTQSNSMNSVPSGFISTTRVPPVNVVITSSDPLPINVISTSQPILSVTIPPQHIKGNNPKPQPHNYQIPLPISNIAQVTTAPSILSKPSPALSTQSIYNLAPSIFSVIPQNRETLKNTNSIEKSFELTPNSTEDLSLNKVNVSTSSLEEHDPCPDFKPVIPLPNEVSINTGEESESELFCAHAKLFRHVNTKGSKEWKERGVGILKVLLNPLSGKVRILMRRDQVHKICANHFVTEEMNLAPMIKNDKAYVWAAHDFADEVFVIETFCVKFRTSEQGKCFYETIKKAKEKLSISCKSQKSTSEENVHIKSTDNSDFQVSVSSAVSLSESTSRNSDSKTSVSQCPTLGGFFFTSTPTFKTKEPATSSKIDEIQETPKNSPFNNFSFGRTNDLLKTVRSGGEAPTFTPLVITQDATTPQNEENSYGEEFIPTTEFKPLVTLPDLVEVKTGEEHLDVLFENRCKLFRYDAETKEWKERGVGNIKVLRGEDVRIVMRREQVHKVCCNHTVLKTMTFTLKEDVGKAILWTAQDFSDNVLKIETFTARFKTEEQASQFLQILQAAQTSMDENNKVVSSKHHKPMTQPRTTSFGDKFKPSKGSWECKNCYIINEGKTVFCIACETPKSGTTSKKPEESGPVFSFGNFANISENTISTAEMSSKKKLVTGWGNAFKPSEGSWECKTCYIRNPGEINKCLSCETLKEVIDNNSESRGQMFTFGIQVTKPGESKTVPSVGFGDAFKPQVGSWECKICLIRNQPSVTYCVSCENHKDGHSRMKNISEGIQFDNSVKTFNFGIPQSPNSLLSNTSISESDQKRQVSQEAKFVFGSPQKHDFEFKPKSPRRISSGQGDEESDGDYTEEEDNIYFKPVIPLPDKIEIKTGEEEEEVLYCHRAKLFRFVNSEWKERGLGDIKILKRKDNGKLRVVMRREQVLKICLNHILSRNIEYLKKDDKSWLFLAADYSDGEIAHEQFCLRFKSPDVAQEFKKAINDALQDIDASDQAVKRNNVEFSDDIELISETKVTDEEEKEAKALGLPPKFFAFRQLPDCTCDQCKKDDEYLKDLFLDDKETTKTNKLVTTATTRFVFGSSSNSKLSSGSFGTVSSTKFSFIPQNQTSEMTNITPLGNNIFSASTTSFNFTPRNQAKSKNFDLIKPSKFSPLSSNANDQNNENKNEEENTPEEISKSFSFTKVVPQSESKITFTQPVTGNMLSRKTDGLFGNSSSTISNNSLCTNVCVSEAANERDSSPSIETIKKCSDVESLFGKTISSTGLNTTNTSIFHTNTGSGDNKTHSSEKNTTTVAPALGSNTFINILPEMTGCSDPNSNESADYKNELSVLKNSSSNKSLSIFGPNLRETSRANLSFGNVSQNTAQPTTTNLKEDDEVVLKCNSEFSFACLAAKTTADAKPAFSKTGDNSFSFVGAGTPVFRQRLSDTKKKTEKASISKNVCDNESTSDIPEEEYDPHYEPIVPLPNAIVVSTGEEDETPLFTERAKVFRYNDAKEWKERGVGQLKILHHPENHTYRLLLRREQVHKVVLNQLITPNLQLQPMLTSDKAWVWAGINYTDDGSELEKLAVRFKMSETAQQFQKVVQNCIDNLIEIQNNKSLPATVQNYGLDDMSSDEQNTTLQDPNILEDPNNDEYEDEEDEDDRSIMFLKRCTLSEQFPDGSWNVITEGDIQVYYDPELYASRISTNNDNGNVFSNTLIGINTVMNIEKNECIWRSVEWADGNPRWRTLKATFNDEKDADELHMNYLESLNYAQQVGIVDEIPREPDTETEE